MTGRNRYHHVTLLMTTNITGHPLTRVGMGALAFSAVAATSLCIAMDR